MPRSLVIAIALLLAVPYAAAQEQANNYQLYLGGYPQQETNWSNDSQGVAHDDNNWFITQTTVIWKIPVHIDLRTVAANTPGVIRRPLSFYTALNGFDHTGDPVVYKFSGVDYLLLPIEGPGRPGTIAVFNCANMAYITHFALPSQVGDAGWCAVDASGIIYSSLQHTISLTSYILDLAAPSFQRHRPDHAPHGGDHAQRAGAVSRPDHHAGRRVRPRRAPLPRQWLLRRQRRARGPRGPPHS